MSCNLAHPVRLNQQASRHRQRRGTRGAREAVVVPGESCGRGAALEVSAMNFNACKGCANISCQDMHMHMSGRQEAAAAGGRCMQKVGGAFVSPTALCLLNCLQGQKQAARVAAEHAGNNFSTRCPRQVRQLQLHLCRTCNACNVATWQKC